jgi:hypothetical protein
VNLGKITIFSYKFDENIVLLSRLEVLFTLELVDRVNLVIAAEQIRINATHCEWDGIYKKPSISLGANV